MQVGPHAPLSPSDRAGYRTRDGAFADYLILPIGNLLEVPHSVSTDAATFTEPLAAALRIREQVQLKSHEQVLVVGDGKLGLLIAQVLLLSGCRVVVVGRHAEKLGLPPNTVRKCSRLQIFLKQALI